MLLEKKHSFNLKENTMITIDTISKKYGKAEVLNVAKIEIPKGQSFGLVGNNGAGKTTLFNILLDLIRPTTGLITNNNIVVSQSEEWKNFTGSFIDESFPLPILIIGCFVFLSIKWIQAFANSST